MSWSGGSSRPYRLRDWAFTNGAFAAARSFARGICTFASGGHRAAGAAHHVAALRLGTRRGRGARRDLFRTKWRGPNGLSATLRHRNITFRRQTNHARGAAPSRWRSGSLGLRERAVVNQRIGTPDRGWGRGLDASPPALRCRALSRFPPGTSANRAGWPASARCIYRPRSGRTNRRILRLSRAVPRGWCAGARRHHISVALHQAHAAREPDRRSSTVRDRTGYQERSASVRPRRHCHYRTTVRTGRASAVDSVVGPPHWARPGRDRVGFQSLIRD